MDTKLKAKLESKCFSSEIEIWTFDTYIDLLRARDNIPYKLSGLLGLFSLVCFILFPTLPVTGCKSTPPSRNKADESETRCGYEQLSCIKPIDSEKPLSLTPLVPQNSTIFTEQERINLYIYIPPQSNRLAVLDIVDVDTGEFVFEQEFELETADTIARLVLPDSVQLVTTPMTERRYLWRFWIYCDPSSVVPISREGWIHRLNSDDAATTPRLWQENLEAWFAERDRNPEAWQQGLTAENLGEYANRPIETYFLGGHNVLIQRDTISKP